MTRGEDEELLRSLGSFVICFDGAVTEASESDQPRTVGPVRLTEAHLAALQRRANAGFNGWRFTLSKDKERAGGNKWLVTVTPQEQLPGR
jgi:hypothetical protein